MTDHVPIPYLMAAIIILLVFAPLGLTAAFFIVYRVVRRPRKWALYFMEVNTAFLGIMFGTINVPMQLAIYLMPFVNVCLPYGFCLAQTLTMRISQGVMVVGVATIAMKRARTMSHGSRSNSKVTEIGSVVLAWVVGMTIGIGPTFHTAGDNVNFIRTAESEFGGQAWNFSDQCADYSKQDQFNAIYLGLLVMTSVTLFGAYMSITRRIKSAIGASQSDRRGTLVGVYRIGDLALALRENVGLQLVTANGRETTVMNGTFQDNLSLSKYVDNWVSEKPSRDRSVQHVSVSEVNLTNLSQSSKFRRYSDRENGIHLISNTGHSEHLSRNIIKSPGTTRKESFEVIEEEDCELKDAISVLSEETIYGTLNADFRGTASVQTNNNGEVKFSDSLLPYVSYGCPSPEHIPHNHNSISRSSTYSPWSDLRSNSVQFSDEGHTSATRVNVGSPLSWTSRGSNHRSSSADSSIICLPPPRHTRSSSSCVQLTPIDFSSLCNFSLSPETSLRGDIPSPLKPSLEKVHSLCVMEESADSMNQSSTREEKRKLCDHVDTTGQTGEGILTSLLDGESQYGGEKSNSLGKARKEQLNASTKWSDSEHGERDNRRDTAEIKLVKTVATDPVQIRVTRPSTEANVFLKRKHGLVQDGVILRVESEIRNLEPKCDTAKNLGSSVFHRHSTSSMHLSSSRNQCSIQRPRRASTRLPVFRRNNIRYKKKLIQRFILAFVVNILTQIPYTVLGMVKPDYQIYKMLQPVLQSIAVISFALSPYIYVLGNKVIHKLLMD